MIINIEDTKKFKVKDIELVLDMPTMGQWKKYFKDMKGDEPLNVMEKFLLKQGMTKDQFENLSMPYLKAIIEGLQGIDTTGK
tara:strand:- start:3495 stop:3740 length:246 start_codon:yes stop_codon:yes gene_type:complete